MCRWIQEHLEGNEKLLIVDNVLLIAWYWKIACQSLLIETTTMHSGLDQRNRTKIVNDFDRKGRFKVLTIMYDVGGQAINLQKQWLSDMLIGRRTQIAVRIRHRDQQSRLEGLHHRQREVPGALIRQNGGTPDGRMGIVSYLSRGDLLAQSIFEDFIERPTAPKWLVQIGHGVSHNQYYAAPVALPTMNDLYHDPASHMQHSNYQSPDNAALRQAQNTS